MSRTPVPVPFAEWAPDNAVQSSFAIEAAGVYSMAGRYRPLSGLTAYKTGSALAGTCIGARGYWSSSGDVYIFAGDEFDLYKLTSRYPAVVSKSGGYSPSIEDGWQFEQFGDYIVAVNGSENPQVYQMGTSSVFADLGGSPPTSRAVWRVTNQLCLANNRTVSVSGFNDITDWTYATATQGVQVDIDGRVGNVQTGVGGEVGLIFGERGIVRQTYVGPPTTFQLDTIEFRHGAISREAVSQYGRQTFFVSETGFLVTDSITTTPIGINRVDNWFASNLNYAARHKVCTGIDYARKLWVIAFPTGGNLLPNHLLIYSMADNRWTHDDIETQMLFEMPREGVSVDDADAILALEGTTVADEITTSVDDPQWRETRVQVAAVDSTGTVSTFEGSARPATISSGEMEPTKLRQTLIDEVWPEIDITSTNVHGFVVQRDRTPTNLTWGDSNLIWGTSSLYWGGVSTASTSSDMNTFGFCPFRTSARYFRIGIEVDAGTNWTEATGITWRGSAGGER